MLRFGRRGFSTGAAVIKERFALVPELQKVDGRVSESGYKQVEEIGEYLKEERLMTHDLREDKEELMDLVRGEFYEEWAIKMREINVEATDFKRAVHAVKLHTLGVENQEEYQALYLEDPSYKLWGADAQKQGRENFYQFLSSPEIDADWTQTLDAFNAKRAQLEMETEVYMNLNASFLFEPEDAIDQYWLNFHLRSQVYGIEGVEFDHFNKVALQLGAGNVRDDPVAFKRALDLYKKNFMESGVTHAPVELRQTIRNAFKKVEKFDEAPDLNGEEQQFMDAVAKHTKNIQQLKLYEISFSNVGKYQLKCDEIITKMQAENVAGAFSSMINAMKAAEMNLSFVGREFHRRTGQLKNLRTMQTGLSDLHTVLNQHFKLEEQLETNITKEVRTELAKFPQEIQELTRPLAINKILRVYQNLVKWGDLLSIKFKCQDPFSEYEVNTTPEMFKVDLWNRIWFLVSKPEGLTHLQLEALYDQITAEKEVPELERLRAKVNEKIQEHLG